MSKNNRKQVKKVVKQLSSEFIRANPNLNPAELVAKAKTKGLDINPRYVSSFRAREKKKTAPRASAQSSSVRTRNTKRAKRPARSHNSNEQDFRKAVLNIGLTRAKALLKEIESALQQ